MESVDRAGFAGYSHQNWAEDHAEGDFGHAGAVHRALDSASNVEDIEAADDDWFEDDLISLVLHRPSRQARRFAR